MPRHGSKERSTRPNTAGLNARCALVLAAAALLAAGCGGGMKPGDSAVPAPSSPPSKLVEHLTSAARGMPTAGASQITNHTSTGLWSLTAVEGGKWFCFALGVPRVTIQSTCATRPQITREQILIHPGSTGRRSGVPAAYLVYGVVSPEVRALTVNLSDCTRIHVALNRRPLFWTFVPRTKVAHRIVPTKFSAKVGSKFIGWPLNGAGGVPAARCKATG